MTTSFASIFLVLAVLLFAGGLFWFRKYTGLAPDKAFMALLASSIAAGVQIFVRLESTPRSAWRSNNEVWSALSVFAAGACIVFATAFALRLWGRWIGGKATPEELQPGQAGVQAWFCASNVAVGLALVVCAWAGYDISPLLTTVAVGAALAAYPLLRMESSAPAIPAAPDHSSGEREKIVSMLEAGKLTPDESAELLQALRQTSSVPSRQTPLTDGQRLMLIGAALVGLGFFLPWLVVNPGKEAGRMMNKMQSSMSSSFNGAVSFPRGMNFPGMGIETSSISISGGDIPRGLGWAALLLALTAALLPYFATTLDVATARTVRLLSLGLGGFILLYLLTQNLRFAGIGLVLAVGGYVLEAVGVFRERRAAGVSRAA